MKIDSNKLHDRRSDGRISFRPAGLDDCKIIWEWANDPASRRASFSSETISWETHSKWFALKLNAPDCIFWVIVQASSLLPVGSIRYETKSDHAVTSVNLAPSQRGRGIGSQAMLGSAALLFQTTSVDVIHAFIKTDNAISIKAFEKSGYTRAGLVRIGENSAYEYITTRPAGILHDQ